MEEKIYQILKKHKISLKKREEMIVDLLPLFGESLKEFCEHVMHPDSDLHKDADDWIKNNLS
jgi:hypothetical protein